MDGSGRYHLKYLNISISGSCKNLYGFKVYKNSSLISDTVNCPENGFIWNYSFSNSDEGEFALTFKGLLANGSIVTTENILVKLDLTAPASPVISIPSSSTFTYSGSSSVFTISGSATSDTYKIAEESGQTVSINSTNWTSDIASTPGRTITYKFIAENLAGNQSAVTKETITWSVPSFYLTSSGSALGESSISDNLNVLKMDINIDSTVSSASQSGINLDTGLSQIASLLRGP